MNTYTAVAYRDENGAWCGRVAALHANTDARTLAELRAGLVEAVEASLDEPEDFDLDVLVAIDSVQAAAAEMSRAS